MVTFYYIYVDKNYLGFNTQKLLEIESVNIKM